MATSNAAIEEILADMRLSISCKKCIPVNRKKNMDALAQLGITWQQAFDEMYTLTSSDYYAGPEQDRNFPNSDPLWIFKKVVNGQKIYIKFKVMYQKNGETKVVSFHIDGV
ncbi:MAG: hypothetical protein ACOX1A_07860 [Saccharofermentanales bacterium]